MSDDIVTRLRGEVIDPARASYHLSYELAVSDLCKTAADEIERIQKYEQETEKRIESLLIRDAREFNEMRTALVNEIERLCKLLEKAKHDD